MLSFCTKAIYGVRLLCNKAEDKDIQDCQAIMALQKKQVLSVRLEISVLLVLATGHLEGLEFTTVHSTVGRTVV